MKVALLFVFALFAFSVMRPAAAGALDCPICEFLVGKAESYLAQNQSEQAILTLLDNACADLKVATWVTDCKSLVGTYAPQIIQKLVNKETPSQICTDLTLCSSSITVPSPKQFQKIQGDLECGVCTFIVGYVENYVEQNKTESEIIAALKNDCTVLKDKSWVATCQGAVTTYGPQIIALVAKKEPASVVCSQVGLCKNSTANVMPILIDSPIKAASNTTCNICEFLVNTAEQYVAQNKTESEIVDLLDDVCNDIPVKAWAAACTSTMNEYGDLIVAYVVNEEPPEIACTEIKLCAPSHIFKYSNAKKLFQ